eukprot:g1781.t1
MGPLLRPREIRGALPGAFWFLLGSAVAVAIFPRDVALQSILHLSVGDPIASVVGARLGDRSRILSSGKSLAPMKITTISGMAAKAIPAEIAAIRTVAVVSSSATSALAPN